MGFDTGGAMSGAASGASMGSAAGPWGAVIGGVAGGLIGGFTGKKKKPAEAKPVNPYLDQQSQDIYREKQRNLSNFGDLTKNRAEEYGREIKGIDPSRNLTAIGSHYSPQVRGVANYAGTGRGDVNYAGAEASGYMRNIGRSYDPVISSYQQAARDPALSQALDVNKQTLAGKYLASPEDRAYANELIQRSTRGAADTAARIGSRSNITGTGNSTMNRTAMANASTLARAVGTDQAKDYMANRYATERGIQDAAVARTPALLTARGDIYDRAAAAENARVANLQAAGAGQGSLYSDQAMRELKALEAGYGAESQMAMAPLQAKIAAGTGEMGIYGASLSPYNTLSDYIKLGKATDSVVNNEKKATGADYLNAAAQVYGAYKGGGGFGGKN
jgi:hypothetical protein